MASRPAPAFVQVDTFSGVNAALRVQVEQLLGVAFDVVDVVDRRRVSRSGVLGAPWANVVPMLRGGGVAGLRHPRACVADRFSTTTAFDHRSELARRALRELRPTFCLQTQTMFDASLPDVPHVIYTDHTMLAQARYPRPLMDVSRKGGWIARERSTYRAAVRVLTFSEFARRSVVEDYGVDPSRVVDVGSGCNVPVPDAPPRRDRPVRAVLFLGFEWERKGGPLLLEAFRRLHAEHPDTRLVVAGCAPALTEPGVEVLGRVPASRVPDLLRDADVFSMPSWVEPSAGVYLEAAAYGLPVVATAVGGTPERVVDGRTGLLSEAGDVQALHENLRRLVLEDGTARRLGAAGHALVRERFTWQAVAGRVVEQLRTVGLAS